MNLLTLSLIRNNFLLFAAIGIIFYSCGHSPSNNDESFCTTTLTQGISGKIESVKRPIPIKEIFISEADFKTPKFKTYEQTLEYLRKNNFGILHPINTNENGCFHYLLEPGTYKISIPNKELNYQILPDSIIEVKKGTVTSINIKLNN